MKYLIEKPNRVLDSTPVYVMMHGVGSNYNDLIGLVDVDREAVIVVSIQGDLNYGPGHAYYIPDFSTIPEVEVINQTVVSLNQEIVSLLEHEGISEHPRYLLGFSQGAILSEVLLATYPDKYDGAVILNARLVSYLKPYHTAKQHKILVIQGSKDPLFPIPSSQKIVDYFKSSNQEVTLEVFEVGHGINEEGVAAIRTWIKNHV